MTAMDRMETQVGPQKTDVCALCCREQHGRAHGARFLCVDCESTQRLVRRNMGSLPPMSEEDKHAFFSKVANTKDSRANWKLVRASLKEVCLRRKKRVHGIKVEAPYKPLKFWTEQGYGEDAVRACPTQSGPMGELFQVVTTTEVSKHLEEEIEAEILERESAAAKKKKKDKEAAGDEGQQADGWHLPDTLPSTAAAAKPTGKARASAKSEARSAAKAEQAAARQKAKVEKKNSALSGVAGKSLGFSNPSCSNSRL